LSAEGVGDPRVLIGVIPDGYSNTSCDGLASGDDGLVISLLLGKESSGGREGHADIELSNGNFNTESGERSKVGLKGRGNLTDDKVALDTNTVEGDTLGLQTLDEVDHSSRLCTGILNVVVIDVELGIGVGCTSGLEGNGDVANADVVVEDIGTVGTIIVERLVDDIPAVYLTLIMTCDIGDVVRHGSSQRGVVPVAVSDPRRELTVPDEVVRTEDLSVGLGKVEDGITTGEAETVLAGLGGVPFHTVSGSDLTEFISVGKNIHICGIGNFWVVGG